MATWPASLPQNQFIGTTDKRQDAVLRSPMDAGPPTRRNRFTATTRQVKCPLIVKGDQRQVFDTFFVTTLANGALPFDWEDPVTDATVSFAFLSPPQWRLRRGGSANTRVWETDLELEIQP